MIEPLTYTNWRPDSDRFSHEDETRGARPLLEWAYGNYAADELVYASSFGAEAIVLIDLIQQIRSDAHLIFLDTGLHFPETYEVIDQIKSRFSRLRIECKSPSLNLDEQAAQYGADLWTRDADLCCHIRKIKPLTEVLSNKKAWISGLRREQSPTRANTNFLNQDDKFRMIKICPLIHWTWEDVWDYIRRYELPYNRLHDHHYPSIGCFPCTRAVDADGDSRAGRWAGSEKTECGLHIASMKEGS